MAFVHSRDSSSQLFWTSDAQDCRQAAEITSPQLCPEDDRRAEPTSIPGLHRSVSAVAVMLRDSTDTPSDIGNAFAASHFRDRCIPACPSNLRPASPPWVINFTANHNRLRETWNSWEEVRSVSKIRSCRPKCGVHEATFFYAKGLRAGGTM